MGKEMVRVPAGEFMMGALEDDEDAGEDEIPRHKVTLTRDFLIGKYPVTQALWNRVMGTGSALNASLPLTNFSWMFCILFCNELSIGGSRTNSTQGLDDYQILDFLLWMKGNLSCCLLILFVTMMRMGIVCQPRRSGSIVRAGGAPQVLGQ